MKIASNFPVQPTVVADFEHSGPIVVDLHDKGPLCGHRVFGFGLAVGYMCPATDIPMICGRMSVGILPSDMYGMPLPKNTNEWARVWNQHEWDDDTLDFWSDRK